MLLLYSCSFFSCLQCDDLGLTFPPVRWRVVTVCPDIRIVVGWLERAWPFVGRDLGGEMISLLCELKSDVVATCSSRRFACWCLGDCLLCLVFDRERKLRSSGVRRITRRITRRLTKGSGVMPSVICDCSVPFPSLSFNFLERCRDAYPFLLLEEEEEEEEEGLVFVPFSLSVPILSLGGVQNSRDRLFSRSYPDTSRSLLFLVNMPVVRPA